MGARWAADSAHGYSPQLLPVPNDWDASTSTSVSGTWLLNVNRLAAALSRLTCDAAIHAAAPGLGGRIAAEDGVGRAVAWIETVLHDAAAVSGGGHSGTVNGGA